MTARQIYSIAGDVLAEAFRAADKHGVQTGVPDGTGLSFDTRLANQARADCDAAFKHGVGTWRAILTEEFREALAESDPAKLRAELIQVAAVAVRWVEAIDTRQAAP